jgi:hypothetical protein
MNNETAGWHGESPQFHCGEDVKGGQLTGGTEHDQLPDRHKSRAQLVIAPWGL